MPADRNRPMLCACQPDLPEFLEGHAEEIVVHDARRLLRDGFESAVASDVRAEILCDALGIEVPVVVSQTHVDAGRLLVVGVFRQIAPMRESQWDGVHRGSVCWFRVYAPRSFEHLPPIV